MSSKNTTGVAGALVGIFMISAVVIFSNSEPEENPYNTTTYDNAQPVHNVEGGVQVQNLSDVHYAQALPSGLHIIYDKASDEYNVVMKYRDEGLDRGYGFFAMDSISESYVPNTQPTSDSEALSMWTIAGLNDILNADMRPGKYLYIVSGDLLNGQDLQLSVVYDVDSNFDEGFGYMGLNVVNEPTTPRTYSYDHAPN